MASLERFVEAQGGVMAAVEAELAAGRKRTHWMWFVFPQLAGLGSSAMARHYGIAGIGEAREYLAHPLLGARLLRCTGLAMGAPEGRSALAVFGSPDDLKFRSCLTLFQAADPGQGAFAAALARFYGGEADGRTLELLGRAR